jgi:hypothetical protein
VSQPFVSKLRARDPKTLLDRRIVQRGNSTYEMKLSRKDGIRFINDEVEAMFSHAVRLAQNGMMKSTIHAEGRDVFILNMDSTILLHFRAPEEQEPFEPPFNLFANDYESRLYAVSETGNVIFKTAMKGMEYIRQKECPRPKTTFSGVKAIWENYKPDLTHHVNLEKKIIRHLNKEVSHVELSKAKGEGLVMVQRDIYSGNRITVKDPRTAEDIKLVATGGDFAFGPLGVRMVDLLALFTFTKVLTLYFQPDQHWLCFADREQGLTGILSTGSYDESGYLGKA